LATRENTLTGGYKNGRKSEGGAAGDTQLSSQEAFLTTTQNGDEIKKRKSINGGGNLITKSKENENRNKMSIGSSGGQAGNQGPKMATIPLE
jgi:hypothetical protein